MKSLFYSVIRREIINLITNYRYNMEYKIKTFNPSKRLYSIVKDREPTEIHEELIRLFIEKYSDIKPTKQEVFVAIKRLAGFDGIYLAHILYCLFSDREKESKCIKDLKTLIISERETLRYSRPSYFANIKDN
jgi:hypothetical protein